MKFAPIVATALLFVSPSHADTQKWIVRLNDSAFGGAPALAGCKTEVLNPNLGADLLAVECPERDRALFKSSLKDGGIAAIERNAVWTLPASAEAEEPTDELMHDQWALDAMNVRSFWENESRGDARVIVALIDSGVDYTHEDLQSALAVNAGEIPGNYLDDDGNGYVDDVYGWDSYQKSGDVMDVFNHGTHVAGIIGATVNNRIGIAGLNWNVSIVPVKMFGPRGEATTEGAIRALDYAVSRGARIINISWGGSKSSPLLKEAFERCREKGILFVAAAGNESADNDKVPTYPASFGIDNIISVAAVSLHDELSWFSNWGLTSVHVAAPGESILSTMKNHRYGFKEGSSMAVPHIVGAAALLWSAHPDWTYTQVRDYILSHCKPLPTLKDKVACQGYFRF